MARLRLVHDRSKAAKSSAAADLAVALPFLLALALAVIAGLGAAHAAQAMSVENAPLMKNGVNRGPASDAPTQFALKIQGVLACDLGDQNTGAPCQMKVRDLTSGHFYQLKDAPSAQALFHSGKKKVVVEGALADPETILVGRIRALD